MQRWVLGTHHGAKQPEHLDAYLDKFVFRFNRRTSKSRGVLFYRLLQQAIVTAPVTYRDVTKKLEFFGCSTRMYIILYIRTVVELNGYPLYTV